MLQHCLNRSQFLTLYELITLLCVFYNFPHAIMSCKHCDICDISFMLLVSVSVKSITFFRKLFLRTETIYNNDFILSFVLYFSNIHMADNSDVCSFINKLCLVRQIILFDEESEIFILKLLKLLNSRHF